MDKNTDTVHAVNPSKFYYSSGAVATQFSQIHFPCDIFQLICLQCESVCVCLCVHAGACVFLRLEKLIKLSN